MAPCLLCLSSAPPLLSPVSGDSLLTLLDSRCVTMRELRVIHAGLIKAGSLSTTTTLSISRLLSFCASPDGDMNYAAAIFARVPRPNLFMWNTMIRGFSQSSSPEKAISLFIDMVTYSDVLPQRLTYPSVFKAYAGLGRADAGAQLHGWILKLGLEYDPFVRNTIIHMYANCGFLGEAHQVFDGSSELDIVAWNSLIMGYAKSGEMEESRRLFDMAPGRNTVTWNSLLSGYVRNGQFIDALNLFHEMQKSDVRPSRHTMVTLLNASAHLGSLTQGRWVHKYLTRMGFELNPIVVTALIDMYSKCGYICRAYEIFQTAPEIGLSCWNSMILGLARNGHEEEAVHLFSQLESSSFKPDSVSFIGVLTACNHGGFVDKAIKYFRAMTERYSIIPTLKHFSCLVDLLGRLGCVEEAEQLIREMPVEADVVLWGSLLWASWKHGNADVAERAAERLIDLDPGESSGYVIMSNVHASSGKFREAAEGRISMKEIRVEKVPGCSSIEVNGQVHEFIAGGGRGHPRAEEIYWVLNEMVPLLQEVGLIHQPGQAEWLEEILQQ
ncbi:hypothetical protein SAY87_030389 [Trapa incisa]|uniref:Pentatricopeptide repeat-containing protein n=1 Tax=Trapa incisa TaxID=236973 RepID=A0AAN7KN70_9MYRT|nr:hypothetical protein SAY87_030389 [Trapa incisa]